MAGNLPQILGTIGAFYFNKLLSFPRNRAYSCLCGSEQEWITKCGQLKGMCPHFLVFIANKQGKAWNEKI
jgi:hypothetical protein